MKISRSSHSQLTLILCVLLLLAFLPACKKQTDQNENKKDTSQVQLKSSTNDTKDYIAFLERKDRATWQKPNKVIEKLALQGNETIVDLGAGSGYFSFKFAEALPNGKIIAMDINDSLVRHVQHRATLSGVTNLKSALIHPDKPQLADDVDLVFVCDVAQYFSAQQRENWFQQIANELPANARFVLVEFKTGNLPEGPNADAKVDVDAFCNAAEKAGLQKVEIDTSTLPYQNIMIFKKPS